MQARLNRVARQTPFSAIRTPAICAFVRCRSTRYSLGTSPARSSRRECGPPIIECRLWRCLLTKKTKGACPCPTRPSNAVAGEGGRGKADSAARQRRAFWGRHSGCPLFWVALFVLTRPAVDLTWPVSAPLVFLLPAFAYPVLEEIAFRGPYRALCGRLNSPGLVGGRSPHPTCSPALRSWPPIFSGSLRVSLSA